MTTWLSVAVFIIVMAFSAAVTLAMIRRGPLDQPDAGPNGRKMHTRPVPKGGGLGTVLAVLGASVWVVRDMPSLAPGLLGGGTLIAVVAYMDDVRDWPFTIKLGAQLAASALVVGGGVWVDHVGPVPLGWAGPGLTFAWIVYVTNAVNFMDGINGLAAGTCAIAGLAIAGVEGLGLAGLVMAAGLAGFLPFNFPRARIFLGDVGSQFCGFALAVLAVAIAGSSPPDALVIPLALLVLLLDVAFTLVRRLLAHERLTQAHRSHLYQLAHRAGIAVPWVTGAVWAMAAWGVLCAYAPWPAAIPLALIPPACAGLWTLRRARARLANW